MPPSRPSAAAGAAGSTLTAGQNTNNKGRRSSKTSNVNTNTEHGSIPEVEDFAPPIWRTVLNRQADFGYPDFYPSRPGFQQPEDVLTEDNVKNGFSAKGYPSVAAEVFSMHGAIHQQLLNGGLEGLNRIVDQLLVKRDDSMPKIGERSFRIPVRVTYNDSRRSQFLADLANPSIPLHRLMRSPVPHGFKGVEMFDLMFSPIIGTVASSAKTRPTTDPIPVERAAWFIRVLGANEISAHRSRAQPAVVPVQSASPAAAATPSSTTTVNVTPSLPLSSNDWYTQEFTNNITSWLRIQLSQLVIPNTTSSNIVLTGKSAPGVLGDEAAKNRWLIKWEYSLSLFLELHSKRLLSNRIITSWLADQLASANLLQIGSLSQLVTFFLPHFARHVINGRQCVQAMCAAIIAIRSSAASAELKDVESLLVTAIRDLHTSNPEVLISPRCWRLYFNILKPIVESLDSPQSDDQRGASTPDYTWSYLEKRNNSLMFKSPPIRSSANPRRQQLDEIQKLDSIGAETIMPDLCRSFFDNNSAPNSPSLDVHRLQDKIFTLLNWSMGLFQLGTHRPYAVYTLLKLWVEARDANSTRSTSMDLFSFLYTWLDTSSAAKKAENIPAIGITFGELIRAGLFSYGRYLQSLIARGHTARSRTHQSPTSHHLGILRALPIFVDTKDLLQQRRIALCGDDRKLRQQDQLEEERTEEAYIEEVKSYVPEIWGYRRYGKSASYRNAISHRLPSAARVSRYIYVHARFRVFPAAVEHLVRRGSMPAMDCSTFARILNVFRQARGGSTLADFLIKAFRVVQNDEVLAMAVDATRRDAEIWTAMDRWPEITDALMDRIQTLRELDHYNQDLVSLLLDLAKLGRVSAGDAAEVEAIKQENDAGKPPPSSGWAEFKESMANLESAIGSGNVEAAHALGEKLLVRHGVFSKWAPSWWSAVIKSLQGIKVEGDASSAVEAAAVLAGRLDEQSERTLDDSLAIWLNALSPEERIDIWGQPTAIRLTTFFLTLVARRHLTAVTLLEKFCFPIWNHEASITLAPRPRLLGSHLRTIEHSLTLAQQLLLADPPHAKLPPQTLCEALIFQTTRSYALSNTRIIELIRHLPHLVVLERSGLLWNRTKRQISAFLQSLAGTPEFKNAAFRHLNLLKDVFLSNEWNRRQDVGLEAGMVETLKMMMSDQSSGPPQSASSLSSLSLDTRLSAWRWTRIVLEMRVELKRLALQIVNNEDAPAARQSLSRLITQTFDQNAETDTDLICEAFRGIEPVVIQEILVSGFDHLTALLSRIIGAEQQDQSEDASRSIDVVLNILDNSIGPTDKLRAETAVMSARHRLLDLVSITLQSTERHLSQGEEGTIDSVTPPNQGDVLKVVLKVLKFALSISGQELGGGHPLPDFARLAVSYLRVLVTLPDDVRPDLQDMLIHIMDNAPPMARIGVQTALLAEMSSPGVQSAINFDRSFVRVLPCVSPPRRTLALSRPDPTSKPGEDPALSLDDRPWENFEYLFPIHISKKHNDTLLSSQPIKDLASIPLTLLDPQITYDLPPKSPSQEDSQRGRESTIDTNSELMWYDLTSERNLGDGMAGEPLIARDLVTGLFTEESPDDKRPTRTGVGLGIVIPDDIPQRRMSTRSATGTKGGKNEPIALEESSEDDEEEKKRATKRPKTSGKTVSKAPRKTTAGKSVSRKATGGKSTRGGKGVKR
ncbi:hypothetical protein M231_06418 [Tremella mesenterica]|uniref:Mediator of RNA polymerase II transcription subunit 12 n=1 Tax=Tremella mesenterica TaxID=5217 RepID=A0A4Q1BBT7_TREME|nr:hypothetical protein M231_06418 [Tremella mesenterica]